MGESIQGKQTRNMLGAARFPCNRLLPDVLSCSRMASSATTPADKAAKGMEAFWDKNRKLNRPLSPHLTVYKFPLPPVMSITHRITGTVLTGAMYIGPIIYLAGSKDFGGYLTMIEGWGTMGYGLVQFTKFSLALSFSYHFVNGVRHLIWDYAAKLGLDQVYKSGYIVMAITLLVTAGLMML